MWGATPFFLKADRSNELTLWVEAIYGEGYRFPWGSPLSVWYAPGAGEVEAQLEEFLRSLRGPAASTSSAAPSLV